MLMVEGGIIIGLEVVRGRMKGREKIGRIGD